MKKVSFPLDLFVNKKYLNNPPKIVIEVDTKADREMLETGNYYNKKTKKLLDFGVEKVIWIYTELRQVMVAVKNELWIIVTWDDEIEVLGCTFSIQHIIEQAEKDMI